MKVAILVNQYPAVSHTFIRREIAGLEHSGVEVERFTIRPTPANAVPDPLDEAERRRTFALLGKGARGLLRPTLRTIGRCPGRFAKALWVATRLGRRSERGLLRNYAYLLEACLLAQEAKQRNLEHVHAHFGTNSATVALLSQLLGGPKYSFTAHGPEEFDGPSQLSLREKIAGASFVVGVSEFGRSQLLRYTDPLHWKDVHVVRCGVDADFLENPPKPVPDVPNFVCIGRLCEQKGQLLLIDAIAALRAQGIRVHVTMIGDGPMRGAIEERIRLHGIEDAITLAGSVSSAQVLEAIDSARALVLPSFAEGLPVVLMEAMARARPVVATFVAGIPELVTGDVGFLVPAGSVAGLVDAMIDVLSQSPEALTAMGRRGRERVSDKHNATYNAWHLLRLMGPSTEPQAADATRTPKPPRPADPIAVSHAAE